MSFQTCMSFYFLQNKEYILKNFKKKIFPSNIQVLNEMRLNKKKKLFFVFGRTFHLKMRRVYVNEILSLALAAAK